MKKNRSFIVAAAMLLFFGLSGLASAQHATDKEALSDLKEVKVIFDITTGNAQKLLGRLGLIEETRDSMIKQGVIPHFVLTVRGPASLLTQKDESRLKLEDVPVANKVQEKLRAMSKEKEYQLNQCAVANRYLKIKDEDTIPEVHVIGNSWISLSAYQNKGYAYIPID